jgi:hypothetical protein
MNFSNAKYSKRDGVNYGVHVTIDDVVSFVPIDEQNSDYVELKKQLDEGSITIESADTQTWDSIRATRNKILIDTDWTMTTGATVDQAQWAAYRQNLRDLPQTYKDKTPDDVVWPTQPSTAGPNT